MKYFFLIFGFILSIWNGPVYGANEWQPSNSLQEKAVYFTNLMTRLDKKASTHNPEEASILTHGHEYNILTPLYMMRSGASPFSGLNGIGEYVTKDFGKARLISCDSGIETGQLLFAAVEINLNDGWYIRKPVINVPTHIPDKQILYPVVYPLPESITKSNRYGGIILFPIMGIVPEKPDPLVLTAHVQITACDLFKGTCHNDNIPLTLSLSHSYPFPTGICPYMVDALKWVPLPAHDKIDVRAVLNKEGNIQLFYSFKKETKILSIQIDDDWTFQEQSKHMNAKQGEIILKPSKPIAPGENIPLKTITSYGIFDTPVHLTDGVFQKLSAPFPTATAFFGGILLFMMTPFWALFWLMKPNSQTDLIKKVKDCLITLCCLMPGMGLLWQADLWHPQDIVQTAPGTGLLIGFILLLLIRSPQVGLLASWLAFLIIPKPYLDCVFMAAHTTPWRFVLFLWWGLAMALPFIWIYRHPKGFMAFYKMTQSCLGPIQNIARLPVIILLIWLIIGSFNIWVNASLSLYTPQKMSQTIQENKIAFVSVENPICVSCVWNKALMLKTGYARYYTQSDRLKVFYAPASSLAGTQLRRQEGTTQLPLNLFFGPNNTYGLHAPVFLNYTGLNKELKAVDR